MAKFKEKNTLPTPQPSPVGGGIIVTPVFSPKLEDYPKITRIPAQSLPRDQDINLAIAGEGALIPEAYGRVMISKPRIFAVGYSSRYMYLGLLWCRGECDAVERVYLGDTLISGSNLSNHTGTVGQSVDTALQSAISGYVDTMSGLCYSSLKIYLTSQDLLGSANSIRAIIRAKKIYDPRITSTVYSTNFALMFRDLAVDKGLTVDETNIGAAADYCDELLPPVTGEKRRWGGLLFDSQDTVDSRLALIAEHAGCFYIRDAGTVKLIPDAPAASIATFDETTNDNIVEASLTLTKRSLDRSPNQCVVEYKHSGAWPWRTAYAETAIPTGDIRPTTFRMMGYQSYSVAYRHAVERQNRYNLSDLSIKFETFDEGLKVETGDIITVTHNVGLTAKLFRVMSVGTASFSGSWVISAEEYDPAIYSDEVKTEPTFPDINLPSPFDIPSATGFTAVPEIIIDAVTGIWSAIALTSWDPLGDAYPFNHQFEIKLFLEDNTLIQSVITTSTEIRLGPLLPSNGLYYAQLTTIGSTGATSPIQTLPVQVSWDTLLPGDVTRFMARGVGNQLRTNWDAVTGEPPVVSYHIKYGAPSVTWANATTIGTVSGLTFNTKDILAGTYDIMMKAVDALGNESETEALVEDVVITTNADGQVIGEFDADHASSVLMTLVNLGTQWVTDSGETWNALYPNAMSTYTNAIYSYQTVGAAEYISEEFDTTLADYVGIWTAQHSAELLNGTDVTTEEVQVYAGAAWNGLSSLSGTYIGSKLRYKVAQTGVVFIVTILTRLAADIEPRVLRGFSTSSASAADQIAISPSFIGYYSVTITVSDTGGSFTGTFDLDPSTPFTYVDFYVWDNSTGFQIDKDYSYEIRGA